MPQPRSVRGLFEDCGGLTAGSQVFADGFGNKSFIRLAPILPLWRRVPRLCLVWKNDAPENVEIFDYLEESGNRAVC
jgi:hypothetical protein